MSNLTSQAAGAASSYLRIFADSPVAWREWNAETLAFAQENIRPLFVSVGSAESQVPHIMANEVFADDAIAEFLNTAFVPVLVDRRQRPHIAHYLSEFSLSRSERIAWPIHAFMMPDLRPFYTFSYIGIESYQEAPGFMELLIKMRGYFEENYATLPDFPAEGTNYREAPPQPEAATVPEMLSFISKQYDTDHGGFGTAPKFPPHAPLLFLMSLPELLQDSKISEIVRGSLDAMRTRKLWDSTHGGFFAYCTDAEWGTPAPEKTLLDQALHLWNYSLAYKQFGHEPYKQAAVELKSCIDSQFRSGSLYISALRYTGDSVELDETILTAWNAILACALVVAEQCGVDAQLSEEARNIRGAIEAQQLSGQQLARSSYRGTVHPHVFLEDYAAMALLDTFLAPPDGSTAPLLFDHLDLVSSFFYGDGWIQAIVNDFRPVPAEDYDSPHPSPASLAELALLLIRLRLKNFSGPESSTYRSPLFELEPVCFGNPLVSDLRNLAAAIDAGYSSPMT